MRNTIISNNTRDTAIKPWQLWSRVGAAFTAKKQSISTVARTTTRLDLFLVGNDGKVYANSSDRKVRNGQWNQWTPIDQAFTASAEATITNVARTAGRLDLFVVGNDGRIYTNFLDPKVNNGRWNRWSPQDPVFILTPQSVVTAVARTPDRLDLFVVGRDGMIYTNFSDAKVSKGQWNQWVPFEPMFIVPPKSVVTAVARTSDRLDLFVVGPDGGIYRSFSDAMINDGEWDKWTRMGDSFSVPMQSVVSAVARNSQQLDLFVSSGDGGVYNLALSEVGEGGAIYDPYQLSGDAIIDVPQTGQHALGSGIHEASRQPHQSFAFDLPA